MHWCCAGLAIVLVHLAGCDASGLVSQIYQYMTSNNPDLPRTLVREFEHEQWESEPANPEFHGNLGSLNDGLVINTKKRGRQHLSKSLENVDLADSQHEKEPAEIVQPQFRQWTTMNNKELSLVLELTAASVGSKMLANFETLTPNIYVSARHLNGYIIVVYRPLLLPADLSPDALRLLYHSWAKKNFELLSKCLSPKNGLENASILLVGAVEAGLMATFHATRLIRKHPIISETGKGQNILGQVQVLTLSAPAPYTPEANELYGLSPGHIVNFASHRETKEAQGCAYVYPGMRRPIRDGFTANMFYEKDSPDGHYYKGYFEEQGLGSLDVANILTEIVVMPKIAVLADRLRAQRREAYAGKIAASIDFSMAVRDLAQAKLFDCIGDLELKLQKTISSKFWEAERYVHMHGLSRNWSFNGSVRCRHVQEEELVSDNVSFLVTCAIKVADGGLRDFATYCITSHPPDQLVPLEPKPEDEVGKMVIKIAPTQESLNLVSQAQLRQSQPRTDDTDCLAEYFEMHKQLQIFSPFHPDANTFLLPGKLHRTPEETFRAALVRHNHLALLYSGDRVAFTALLTAPHMKNPPSCQESTRPPPTRELGNSATHWLKFIAFVNNPQLGTFVAGECISHLPLASIGAKEKLHSLLWGITSANLDVDPTYHQYDCTDAQTLHHSPTFCPHLCRVLINSNFCKRVHISSKGLKIILRGDSAVHASCDRSGQEWETMSHLSTKNGKGAAFFLKLRDTQGKHYYLAVILEGNLYKKYEHDIGQIGS